MKIIAGCKFNNATKWYLSDDSIWYLDLTKMDEIFGYKEVEKYRKGIEKITDDNLPIFLENIKSLEISVEDLRNEFPKKPFDLCPALFVDFDKKIFYDNFPEPNNLEYALCEDWSFSCDDIDDVVDKSYNYWLVK